MRAIIAGLAAALSLAAAPAFADSWLSYRNEAMGFAVDFPASPEVVSVAIPTPVGEVQQGRASAGEPGGLYMVALIDMRKMPETTVFSLEKGAQGAVDAVKGVVTARRDITVQGVPAIEVDVAIPDDGDGSGAAVSTIRVVYSRRMVLSLSAMAPAATGLPPGARRFLRSFTLIGPAAP